MNDGLLTRMWGFFRRIIMLPLWLTPLIAGPSFLFLGWTLTYDAPPLAQLMSYHLSAYALVVCVTALMRLRPLFRRRLRWVKALLGSSQLGPFLRHGRTRRLFMFCGSMLWHLGFAVVRLASGVVLRSLWLQTMGVYHLVLAALRFVIVRPYIREERHIRDWRSYRNCGRVLLVLDLALITVLTLVVRQGESFRYPGPLIYLMAAYAFCTLISATVKLATGRQYGDPRTSAGRVVSLTQAMASMLTLEIALIDRFGDGDPAFRSWMICLSGGAVCLVNLAMAVYMIRRANGEIK